MDPEYETQQLDIFKTMVSKGLIFRGYKPVYWSPSSQTALAEAELEYHDQQISQAAYIAFPCRDPEMKIFENLCAIIWTTTPWTIAANMALSVHPDVEYCIMHSPSTQTQILLESNA